MSTPVENVVIVGTGCAVATVEGPFAGVEQVLITTVSTANPPTVTALAPLHWVWAAAITLPLLVWLLDAAPSWRSAFGTGAAFGFGYFTAGLYWVANAFMVYADTVGWAAVHSSASCSGGR